MEYDNMIVSVRKMGKTLPYCRVSALSNRDSFT